MRRVWTAALLALSVTLAAEAAPAATQSLTILHDNDIHGHLRSFCYVETGEGPDEHCDLGGAARRATLVKRLRAEAQGPVVLTDSGDTGTRGPLTTEYRGLDEIAAMNAVGYDLAALGNNEFKLLDAEDAQDAAGAQDALARVVRASRFPWICANVTLNDRPPPGVQPFVVRRIGRLRVAFLGLTTAVSRGYPQTRGLTFTDPVEAARLWIPRARAKADVVIAVTHLGVVDDLRLVRSTTGIAAVVGGHSHTFLYKPMEPKNADGVVTPIVQDGEFGVRLGVMHLTFSGDAATGWRLAAYDDALIPVEAAIRPDPQMARLVERYASPLDEPVGQLAEIGDTPKARLASTADILSHAWMAAAGSEVGLHPEGDLFEVFRSRAVSRFQVHAILPFHETLWKGELSGERLKALLDKPSGLGGVMHASIPVQAIDPAKTYTVATVGFVAAAIMRGAVDTHADARCALEAWLKARPPG